MAHVIVDPQVPEADAQLLRENGTLLARVRRGWVPPPQPSLPGKDHVQKLQVGLASVFTLLLMVSVSRSGFNGFTLLVAVGAIVMFMAVLIKRDLDPIEDAEVAADREVYEQARWYEGRYVLVAELDESAQRLLARAGQAVRSVLGSEVHAEGLLDDVRNTVMLPAEEWEIARLLAKLSALRAQHRKTVSGGITPEVAAAAAPLARALDSSEEAVVARVEALERYAVHVAEAERAYHAHAQIEELRERLPQYEELVAESGADALAVPELERLAGDAGRLEQALRQSVRCAHEAFRHLDPAPADPAAMLPEALPARDPDRDDRA
ncbi:hypothetical protein [Nonomuraea typhae]|uniref:hypothetical protein n=1 Tax=Nonomuraea typhae TaxID=2603600 RepID=UPI0015E22E8F|nr:hypothetical protein [Nonomuraea typhae]